ncbi:MAG: nucleotidyltransferase family protein [Cyclobacteriaceae bacterium]|nr:nucleotidyltransferase family protein [Cyclobacteriaceae bacterium]
MKAMILAAGLGTRLREYTGDLPKALAPVNGIPMLEYVIRKLKYFGFNQIIINIHYKWDIILEFLETHKNFGIDIQISDERDLLLNTGGGLWKASWFFDKKEPFLVHNADVLSDINLTDLVNFHTSQKAMATLCVRKRKASRYLVFDEKMQLSGWKNPNTGEHKCVIEKKVTHLYGFSSIYVINPAIFNVYTKDTSKAFSIIDVFLDLAPAYPVTGYRDDAHHWFDIGTPEKLKKAEEFGHYFLY